MVQCKNKGSAKDYVYDISLDGSVVVAGEGKNMVVSNTDGFNFQLPKKKGYRYTEDYPYIGKGLSRETKEGKKYTGFEADVAEFNDLYMREFMGLGINSICAS